MKYQSWQFDRVYNTACVAVSQDHHCRERKEVVILKVPTNNAINNYTSVEREIMIIGVSLSKSLHQPCM